MAAAPQVKSDTAARARRDRRRQRMMPGNGAARSVGRAWLAQYPSSSKRPPRAKWQPPPPDANVTVLFPPHDGARPRAADLLANSPDWLKAAPMRENLLASWRQFGQKQDHCPSLLNHNAKYKRLLPPYCDFANGVGSFSGRCPRRERIPDKLGATANPAYVALGSEGRETGMHP